MEKRLLLVFALTFVVILLFQPILKKYHAHPPPPGSQKPRRRSNRQGAGRLAREPARPPRLWSPPPPRARPSAEAPLVIENDIYRITFSNRGARSSPGSSRNLRTTTATRSSWSTPAAAEQYGYPMSLFAYDESLRNKLNSALYITESSGTLKTSGRGHLRIL